MNEWDGALVAALVAIFAYFVVAKRPKNTP